VTVYAYDGPAKLEIAASDPIVRGISVPRALLASTMQKRTGPLVEAVSMPAPSAPSVTPEQS